MEEIPDVRGGSPMQLSAEEYESLIQSIKPYQKSCAGERRQHARVGTGGSQVTIIPLSGNATPKPISVGVCDISQEGVGIVHNETMEVGRQFLLCLSYGSDVGTTRMIVCIVRRVEQTPEGEFRIGCEFSGMMHPEVATDEIAPGLKRRQAKLFAQDASDATDGTDATDAGSDSEPKRSSPFWLPASIASLFRRKSA
jgi:hypothetical protein